MIHRKESFGASRSTIESVIYTLKAHERSIVLEDDLVVSPYLFQYVNEAWDLCRNDGRVASVHGYCYPVIQPLPETFFLGAIAWGRLR